MYDDDERDELEESIDRCGLTDEGETWFCWELGTEHCSFFCVWHDTIGQQVDKRSEPIEPGSTEADDIPF